MDSLQKMPVADRLRRVGSTDQLYSVTRVTVDEGKARGTAMYQVKTGGGLSYEVTADNGLDIGCLSYRGVNVSFLAKNGYVSPYGSHPFEEDFTHTFTGGMLYTCGLLSTGPANRDADGVWQPLHGRYHNLSADQCFGRVADHAVIEVGGRIQETRLFGHSLEVRRTITSPVGSGELTVTDILTNNTPAPMEYMLLYHMNFGYPFLTGELEMELPEGTVTKSRTEEAAKGLGRERTFQEPVDGLEEQVFFHLVPEEEGLGRVRLYNPTLGFGAEVTWTKDTLPIMAQWKCMRSGEYVLGIEPTNSYVMGRSAERENGTIGLLQPFESKRMQVTLRFFDR